MSTRIAYGLVLLDLASQLAFAGGAETSSGSSTESGRAASPLRFPAVPQFYSPCVFFDEGRFRMWTTAGDRVRYYESADGLSWEGGSTVFHAEDAWEMDGNTFEGYRGGISDPRVLKGVTPGHGYTLYYTAGPAPNNDQAGGIGIAFSDDGKSWMRFAGNPLRRHPGGYAFVSQAYVTKGRVYLHYLGGGSQAESIPPSPRLLVLENGTTVTEETVLEHRAYPLAHDPEDNTFWLAESPVPWTSAGPPRTVIYRRGDIRTGVGEYVAEVGASATGLTANWGVALVERSPRGALIEGRPPRTLVFCAGDLWGSWQPYSVRVP